MPSWVNGLGQTLGDALVTARPLLTSYTTYFVNSATGTDGGANNGLEPDAPAATIGAVLTAAGVAAVTPIVVLMSGHTETLTSTLTPTAGTIIVGGGLSGGLPTVKLKMNASNTILFTCSAAGVQLRNVWIQSNQVASNVARVKFTGTGGLVSGCYFECGATDNAAAVEFGATSSNGRCETSSFISTVTTNTTRPSYGLLVSSAVSDIGVIGCSFSDGTLGFSQKALAFTATVTRARVEGLSLLLGASASFGATTGVVLPSTVTGGGVISYTGGA